MVAYCVPAYQVTTLASEYGGLGRSVAPLPSTCPPPPPCPACHTCTLLPPPPADVEFGRVQARDLLQHLWTGPTIKFPVEIIQVGRWGGNT